jgi:hypothetical protein
MKITTTTAATTTKMKITTRGKNHKMEMRKKYTYITLHM